MCIGVAKQREDIAIQTEVKTDSFGTAFLVRASQATEFGIVGFSWLVPRLNRFIRQWIANIFDVKIILVVLVDVEEFTGAMTEQFMQSNLNL